MRTVIVSDETAERMIDVLRRSSEGREVLELFDRSSYIGLPSDDELARALRESEVPPTVAFTVARLEAAEEAVEHIRAQLHAIVRDAREMRITVPQIMRWTGLSSNTIYRILNREESP